ncbi:MAG: AAA family ATPase [Desulfovibrionaceae bacterium]|nr:AAA family ATPase [Desulfovibrionaceae bacterium]
MNSVMDFDAGEVFGKKATGKKVRGWARRSPYTPQIDPHYHFPVWASDIVVWLLAMDEPLYLFGPTGCGKTSCIKQIVTKLNHPVYEVTGHSRLEFPEMVGHHTVKDGSMHFEYGPLALAMKHGGIFLLNEIDLLDPSTAAGLNSVLDGYPLSIPENGGELIVPHEMFRFVATANSNGGSDETGLYQGVLRQNLAFMDRFVLVEASYLPEDLETRIVQSYVPDMDTKLVKKMLRFANAVRRLFIGDAAENIDMQIEVTFSTRSIIRWALLTAQYEPLGQRGIDVVQYALDRALGFRASAPTYHVLRELKQRIFG